MRLSTYDVNNCEIAEDNTIDWILPASSKHGNRMPVMKI